MWGLGAASKWTVFYAGIGLAVLYFIGLFQKLRDWPKESDVPKGPWLCATLLFSVLCFVLIPFAIYTASYLPYAKALGVDTSLGATLRGLGDPPRKRALVQSRWKAWAPQMRMAPRPPQQSTGLAKAANRAQRGALRPLLPGAHRTKDPHLV